MDGMHKRLMSVLAGVLLLGSCDTGDPTRGQLATLAERHASRQDVEAVLGPGLWYGRQRSGEEAVALQKFLDHEPASWGRPLRDAWQRGDGVLHYNSMWQMTWLFFDESDRLVGYWLTAQ